ncbi:Uncharacterized protein Tdes44962_MAKER09073 [Teratosphaeria destructans]|uniref:Uncharacterized protein n=1 Tax=Teratosphaeria destructans TaxID=418781 RepID=A0A9W7SUH8_9PEZI|nr:Uncharacterized protein Tdes44962_MAKER09073 [Teratosphaeria destructans]
MGRTVPSQRWAWWWRWVWGEHGGEVFLDGTREAQARVEVRRRAWVGLHDGVEAGAEEFRHGDVFGVGGLDEDAEGDGGGGLVGGVAGDGAVEGEGEGCEAVGVGLQEAADLGLEHVGFLRDVETRKEPVDFGLAEFGGRRGEVGGDAVQGDAVGAELVEGGVGEEGGDVGVEVPGSLDLVEELRSTGLGGDLAAGGAVLGDDDLAVGGDFGDGEADVVPAVGCEGFEAGEVAAADVAGALDEVAGDEGVGEFVELVASPGVPPVRGADDGTGVADAAADDDVGAAGEGERDTEPAEVLAGAEVGEAGGGVAEEGERDLVAGDVGDVEVEAFTPDEVGDDAVEGPGVAGAGVGDDLDAVPGDVGRAGSRASRKVGS